MRPSLAEAAEQDRVVGTGARQRQRQKLPDGGLSTASVADQHKAGIRAAGSVLKRGIEVLMGPVLHLQGIPRAQAEEVEEGLAEALRAEGLIVQGGH